MHALAEDIRGDYLVGAMEGTLAESYARVRGIHALTASPLGD